MVVGICPQCGRAREPSHRFCPQCGFPVQQIDASSSDPLVGRTLGGSYVLLERIGSGGMGCVYRAEQRTLGRTVAVKVIHAHLLHDPLVGPRFFNEAHAASRLSHPNVVGVIDFGQTDDGIPFLVMEYLRGHELKRVMHDAGLLPIERVLSILRQTLDALAEAHDLGVVHRDLKPANIVLEQTRSGIDLVKVVDFGLAKILHGSSDRVLNTDGAVRGTPVYMAPEQANGGAIDGRTDLYAVGVILYELLTGQAPFERSSAAELLLCHVHEAAPDPRTLETTRPFPGLLADIALRALAKNPDDRFQTADAFAKALDDAECAWNAEYAHPTIPVPGRAESCELCGEPLSASQKFCGSCGVPVPSRPSFSLTDEASRAAPPPFSQVRRGRSSTHMQLRVEGGEDDLAWLHELRMMHGDSVLAVRLVGNHGVGKTTLLREFLAASRAGGDVVAIVEPDPWWAKPGYYAIRKAILQLVRLPDGGRDPMNWSGTWPAAELGLRAIFHAELGSDAATSRAVREGAREALRWAVQRASSGSLTGRVVVSVDDLERIDGASVNALFDAIAEPSTVPWMVVASHATHFTPRLAREVPERVLQGMPVEGARAMLRGLGAGADTPLRDAQHGRVSPLLIEQAARLHIEGGGVAPTGLADLVSHRIATLPPQAKSVLHALAVLGDDVSLEDLRVLLDDAAGCDQGLFALAVGGFVDRGPHGLRWVNPLFREIARGNMPAAVRRRLYGLAADLLEEREAPLEARACYAMAAGRGVEALFLLEQCAAGAAGRADDEGVIRALRKGFAFAQRPSRKGELEDPIHAAVVFGRKLGEALTDAGRYDEASSVLRDVLQLAGPDSRGGVDVLRALAAVARAENRAAEASEFLQEAITRARTTGAREALVSLEALERKWAS